MDFTAFSRLRPAEQATALGLDPTSLETLEVVSPRELQAFCPLTPDTDLLWPFYHMRHVGVDDSDDRWDTVELCVWLPSSHSPRYHTDVVSACRLLGRSLTDLPIYGRLEAATPPSKGRVAEESTSLATPGVKVTEEPSRESGDVPQDYEGQCRHAGLEPGFQTLWPVGTSLTDLLLLREGDPCCEAWAYTQVDAGKPQLRVLVPGTVHRRPHTTDYAKFYRRADKPPLYRPDNSLGHLRRERLLQSVIVGDLAQLIDTQFHPRVPDWTSLSVTPGQHAALLASIVAAAGVPVPKVITISPPKALPESDLRAVNRAARMGRRGRRFARMILRRLAAAGRWVYRHCGHITDEAADAAEEGGAVSVDPVSFVAIPTREYNDPSARAWCGHTINGSPVSHRSGSRVRTGLAPLGESFDPDADWVMASCPKRAEPGTVRPQIISVKRGEPVLVQAAPRPRKKKTRGPRAAAQQPTAAPTAASTWDAAPEPLPQRQRRTRGPRAKKEQTTAEWVNEHFTSNKPQGFGLPGFDGLMEATSRYLLASKPEDPKDPRHKSRNLGHLVDGVVGKAADLIDGTPVVGPLLEPLTRVAVNTVRAVEDAANLPLKPFQQAIFLVTLLSVLLPVTANTCDVGGVTMYTNACRREQVYFCWDTVCFTDPRCIPCESGTCWFQRAQGLATRNATTDYLFDPKISLDLTMSVLYSVDLVGAGELAAIVIAVGDYLRRNIEHPYNFTCDCNCGDVDEAGTQWSHILEITSSSLSEYTGHVTDLLTWVGKLTWAGLDAIRFVHPSASIILILHCLTMQWGKAVLVLLVLTLANPSAGQFTYLWWVNPHDHNYSLYDEVAYKGAVDTEGLLLIEGNCSWPRIKARGSTSACADGVCNGCTCNVNVTLTAGMEMTCFADMVLAHFSAKRKTVISLAHHLGRSAICTFINRSAPDPFVMNCKHDVRPKECGQCFCDCGPALPYSKCGISPRLTPNINVSVTKTAVAGLLHPASRRVDLVDSTVEVLAGKPTYMTCGKVNHTRGTPWLPMPGAPLLATAYSIRVCPGHAWPTAEAGSGGLIRTSDNGELQVLLGVSHFVPLIPYLHHTLLLAALMFLAGSRGLVAIYLVFTTMDYTWASLSADFAIAMYSSRLPHSGFGCLTRALVLALALESKLHWLLAVMLKLSTGYMGLALAGLYANTFLPPLSVTGETKVCVCVDVGVLATELWDEEWSITCLSWFVCGVIVLSTPGMERLRLRMLYISRSAHVAVSSWVSTSPVGALVPSNVAIMRRLVLWCCATMFPEVFARVCIWLYGIALCLDFALVAISRSARAPVRMSLLLKNLECVAAILRSAWAGCPRIPQWPKVDAVISERRANKTENSAVQHGARIAHHGMDLTAAFNPPASEDLGLEWEMCSPIIGAEPAVPGILRSFVCSLSGRQAEVPPGSVYQIGTMTGTSCGFVFNGNLMTTYHGTRGRSITTPAGAAPPTVVAASDDMAFYPPPPGSVPLLACQCAPDRAYLPLVSGELVEVYKGSEPKVWAMSKEMPLRLIKGTSGMPLLCESGHVIAMMQAARHRNGAVAYIVARPIEADLGTGAGRKLFYAQSTGLPEVGATFQVRSYVAPTGAGKTTAIPKKYVDQGYKVLVLNPSVATTASVAAYMKRTYDIDPNRYYSDTVISTGSPLSYSTYGKFIAMKNQLLHGVDIVICDECHSTDATTVLGIGTALLDSEGAGAKLVILATATPPGVPMSPHPNIKEKQLDSEGEIKFAGKSLHIERYKKGRHVIFCTTKAECARIAGCLQLEGINAIMYYRGLPISDITDDEDLVVCATDALMTGYSGNFDTCTDSCTAIEQAASIQYNPSVEICLRMGPASTVTRMQRRGRTGRGRSGIYYYATDVQLTSGAISLATLFEVYDTALCWYDMSTKACHAYLEAYTMAPNLPGFTNNIDVPMRFYDLLQPFVAKAVTKRAMEGGFSHALLTAAQADLCMQTGAGAPDDSERWKYLGLEYDPGKHLPLIARLDYRGTHRTLKDCPLAKELRKALGLDIQVDTSISSALLAAGLAISAAAIVIDKTSSLVYLTSYQVANIGANLRVSREIMFAAEALLQEETMTYPAALEIASEWVDKCRTAVTEGVTRGAAWLSERVPNPSVAAAAPLVEDGLTTRLDMAATWLAESYNTWVSAGSALTTLMVAGKSGALASITAAVASYHSSLAPSAKALLSLLGACVVTSYAPTNTAALVAIGGLVGTGISRIKILDTLVSMATGYAAATSAALIGFKLAAGEAPSLQECIEACLGVFNMGASVSGLAFGFAAYYATGSATTKWVNRFLALNTKGNCLPNDFFLDADGPRQQLRKLLEAAPPRAIFNAIQKWSTKDTTEDCGAAGTFASTLQALVVDICRRIAMWVQTKVDQLTFKAPFVQCVTPYRGPWKGNGTIQATCRCGAVVCGKVTDGKAVTRTSSTLCCSWVRGGVPLYEAITVNCCPDIDVTRPGKYVFPLGMSEWIEVETTAWGVRLTKTTTMQATAQEMRAALLSSPVLVDGAQVAPGLVRPVWLPTDFMHVDGTLWSVPRALDEKYRRITRMEVLESIDRGADLVGDTSSELVESEVPEVTPDRPRKATPPPLPPSATSSEIVDATVQWIAKGRPGFRRELEPVEIAQSDSTGSGGSAATVVARDCTQCWKAYVKEHNDGPPTTAAELEATYADLLTVQPEPEGAVPTDQQPPAREDDESAPVEESTPEELEQSGAETPPLDPGPQPPTDEQYNAIIEALAEQRYVEEDKPTKDEGDSWESVSSGQFSPEIIILNGSGVDYSEMGQRFADQDVPGPKGYFSGKMRANPNVNIVSLDMNGYKSADETMLDVNPMSIIIALAKAPSEAETRLIDRANASGADIWTCMCVKNQPGVSEKESGKVAEGLAEQCAPLEIGYFLYLNAQLGLDNLTFIQDVESAHATVGKPAEEEETVGDHLESVTFERKSSPEPTEAKLDSISLVSTAADCGETKVRFKVGSIMDATEPVITNPANADFNNAGGVAAVISKAAGPLMEHELQNKKAAKRAWKTGDAIITNGGMTSFKAIVHVVSHKTKGNDEADARGLSTAIIGAAITAKSAGYDEIAMPMLGTGIYGCTSAAFAEGLAKSTKLLSTTGLRTLTIYIPEKHRQVVLKAQFTRAMVSEATPSTTRVAWEKVKSAVKKVAWKAASVAGDTAYSETATKSDAIPMREVKTSFSYVWDGTPIIGRPVKFEQTPVPAVTGGLMKNRNIIYATDPGRAAERMKKVTVWRNPVKEDKHLTAMRCAVLNAARLNRTGYTPDHQVRTLLNGKSAACKVSGLTAREAKNGTRRARRIIDEAHTALRTEIDSKWFHFNIMAKKEIFCATPDRGFSRKPPRFIVYPHLPMRFVEKRIITEPANTLKRTMGAAYGFQYTPQERAQLLAAEWRKRKCPMGFGIDTVCFDSRITPEDIQFECEYFCATTRDQSLQADIRHLHSKLYKGGKMYNSNGEYVGTRNCRASGVATTSAGNTITCYVKARAALNAVGLQDAFMLVCGDDVAIIAESSGSPETDLDTMERLRVKLDAYGLEQAETPAPSYTLDGVESCSSNTTSAVSVETGKLVYIPTRSCLTPLARASVEVKGRDPTASWLGWAALNWGTLWAKWLGGLFIEALMQADEPDGLDLEFYGCKVTIPVHKLPAVILALNGRESFWLRSYTTREFERLRRDLETLGAAPVKKWKERMRNIRKRAIERGGTPRKLAEAMLNCFADSPPALSQQDILYADQFKRKWKETPLWSMAQIRLDQSAREKVTSFLKANFAIMMVAAITLLLVGWPHR
uniref:Polyprotein n=1 Tax=Datemikevirus sp. TaxID=3163424 RepID=A0AAU7SS58_9VIRU